MVSDSLKLCQQPVDQRVVVIVYITHAGCKIVRTDIDAIDAQAFDFENVDVGIFRYPYICLAPLIVFACSLGNEIASRHWLDLLFAGVRLR